MAKTSFQYNLSSATFAFLLWGGWSYYINGDEEFSIGVISGLTQGIVSFIITFIVVYAVTKIFNVLPESYFKPLLPACIVVSCIAILLVIIHTFVGTPHILATIAPSLTVGFLFCLFTTTQLKQSKD